MSPAEYILGLIDLEISFRHEPKFDKSAGTPFFLSTHPKHGKQGTTTSHFKLRCYAEFLSVMMPLGIVEPMVLGLAPEKLGASPV